MGIRAIKLVEDFIEEGNAGQHALVSSRSFAFPKETRTATSKEKRR